MQTQTDPAPGPKQKKVTFFTDTSLAVDDDPVSGNYSRSNSQNSDQVNTSAVLKVAAEKKINFVFYNAREKVIRKLETRLGASVLNEITLLESGSSVVKQCSTFLQKNKETNQNDLIFVIDYEASTKSGPLVDLCEKHNPTIDLRQYQRSTFIANAESGGLSLLNRKIISKETSVGYLSFPPYATVNLSVSSNPVIPLNLLVFPLTLSFIYLLKNTLIALLKKFNKIN